MTPGWIALCRVLPCPFLEPAPSVGGGTHRPLTSKCPCQPLFNTVVLCLAHVLTRALPHEQPFLLALRALFRLLFPP